MGVRANQKSGNTVTEQQALVLTAVPLPSRTADKAVKMFSLYLEVHDDYFEDALVPS